jgi:hypothetical protein
MRQSQVVKQGELSVKVLERASQPLLYLSCTYEAFLILLFACLFVFYLGTESPK